MSIKPVKVKRDEYGHFYHPNMPEWDEGTTRKEVDDWANKNNVTIGTVMMDSDMDDEEFIERWFDEGLCDCTPWEPSIPDNAFLLGIYDTEDGPCAMFAIRVAA